MAGQITELLFDVEDDKPYYETEEKISSISAQIIKHPEIGYEYQEWYRQQYFAYVRAGQEIFRQRTYAGDPAECRDFATELLSNVETLVTVTRYISDERISPFGLSFEAAASLSRNIGAGR